MTKFISLALLAAPFASALTVTKQKHEEKIIIIKKPVDCSTCPGDATSACYLPGSDASSYVECSNGQPVEMACSPGLVWNQELEACDWPQGSQSDSTDGSTQHKQWFNICNMCKFYPNQYGSCYMPAVNPTKYITCANGVAYSQSCPSGLVWSQRQETCNWPKWSRTNFGSASSNQADSLDAPAPAPSAQPSLDVDNVCDSCVPNEYGSCYLADPASNHSYIECSNGAPTYKQCPNNLVWNQELETCDWPSTTQAQTQPSRKRRSIGANLNVCSMCVFLQNEYGTCFIPSLNPKKYIMCDNGQPVSQECASGLVWNQIEQTCDFPRWQKAEQKKQANQPADGSADGSSQNNNKHQWFNPCNMCIFYRNSYGTCYMPSWNPTKFVQCSNGVAYTQQCGPGLVWNQMKETCDWPKTRMGKRILGDN